jgi:hypothetical protein
MAAVTDAAMLTLLNEAMQKLTLGEEYSINNRKLKRSDMDMIMKAIDFYERRVNNAAGTTGGTSGGIILADFEEPT